MIKKIFSAVCLYPFNPCEHLCVPLSRDRKFFINYDCQKVVRRFLVLINVRRLIFVIKAREYWVIIKRTPSR